MKRRVIINADDFGASVGVNEAIEKAHREGLLTSTSLLVAGEAAHDAVERAKRNPNLKVGLHVAVVDAPPASACPDLCDANGRLSGRLLAASMRFATDPRVRRQLEGEIVAQFRRFTEYGLQFDHVNTHKHMHLHPAVMAHIMRLARQNGACGFRTLVEPSAPLRLADKASRSSIGEALLRRHAQNMRRKIHDGDFVCNDHLFGLRWTGGMTEARLLSIIPLLPDGLAEVYCHPSTRLGLGDDETAALCSSRVREAFRAHDIRLTSYTDEKFTRAGFKRDPSKRAVLRDI